MHTQVCEEERIHKAHEDEDDALVLLLLPVALASVPLRSKADRPDHDVGKMSIA